MRNACFIWFDLGAYIDSYLSVSGVSGMRAAQTQHGFPHPALS